MPRFWLHKGGGSDLRFVEAGDSRMVRRESITVKWAGSDIPLNAVGPRAVTTPITAPFLGPSEAREQLLSAVGMPLNAVADPTIIAESLAWLTGEENTHVTGQVIFVDSGADVSVRGPQIFGSN